MILSTHAVVGAAAASVFPAHPLVAFSAGFLSHFVVDAIPHWHYHLASISNPKNKKDIQETDMLLNRNFPFDLVKIALDGLLGLAIVYIFFGISAPYLLSGVLLGAIGGMLPDALQFAYWKWRHEPLKTLQRFHVWIHAQMDLDHWPILGPLAQVVIVILCVVVVKSGAL